MIKKGRVFFTILLIIVISIALVLSGYLIYKYISDAKVDQEASDAVDEFENSIITVAIDDEDEEPIQQNTVSGGTTSSSGGSSVKYKGYDIYGTIKIPKTGTKYPIVNSTESRAMEVAIVMLYGPGLNQIGNTVLVGHNYRGGSFFGSNKKLNIGDEIYITDWTGNEVKYIVYNKYETSDSDFEYATRDTKGKREISLSTCTSNASVRLIIWAKEQ